MGHSLNARNRRRKPQVTGVRYSSLATTVISWFECRFYHGGHGSARGNTEEGGGLERLFVFSEGGFGRRIDDRSAKGGLFSGSKIREGQVALLPPQLDLPFGGCGFLFVGSGIARQIDGLRGKGKTGAGLFDDIEEAQQQIFADGDELSGIASEHVAVDLKAQGTAIEIGEADGCASAFDFGVFVEHPANFG